MSDPTTSDLQEVELSAEDPWPGLASFAEESNPFFKGREREAEEVSRLIRREFICVLFGKSGTGKSSLLRAGVFPHLRPSGFLPVYVRLRHGENEPTLVDQVKESLVETIRSAGNEIEAPEPGRDQGLWEYFHRIDTDWWGRKNRLITPVLVLDQFEEILTLGRESGARVERANAFLSELEDLIEGRVPDSIQKRRDGDPKWRTEFDRTYDLTKRDLRIVLTLREDFLADLESLRERLKPVMLNRYRLLPMTGAQALRVVLDPAPGLVDESVALQILQRVSVSERSTLQANPTIEQIVHRSIEPALLSVFCAELNRRRKAGGLAKIDASLLEGAREEILSDFYQRSFIGLPPTVRDFVEDKLLTITGARDRCEISNALSYDLVDEPVLRTLINRRLIRKEMVGSSVWIEFTHDIIADVARASKRSRQERNRIEAAERDLLAARNEAMVRNHQRKRAMRVALVCAVLCLASVIMAIDAWYANRATTKAYGKLQEVKNRKSELEKTVAQLDSERQSLQKTTQGLVQASAVTLNDYAALAEAALLDPYPRSNMLVTLADLDSVKHGFAAIKAPLANSRNSIAAGEQEFIVAAEGVIEAILRNQLELAATECDLALARMPDMGNQTKSKLLRFKGDILVRRVLLARDGRSSVQETGSTPGLPKDLLTNLNDAWAAYTDALALVAGDAVSGSILLARQARVEIWKSRFEEQAADHRNMAAGLIDQAEARLQNLSALKEPPPDLLLGKLEVARMRGFLSVSAGDDRRAATYYEQSVSSTDEGEDRKPDGRLIRSGIATEKLLALVQLANCYERLIKEADAANPPPNLNDYKTRLADTLAERIALGKQILTRYRSSRFVAQILGFSYFDQGRCSLEYSLPGLSEADAYGGLRRGFILTLSDKTARGDDLRKYFEQQVAKKWHSEDVAKALSEEMTTAIADLQWLFQENKEGSK